MSPGSDRGSAVSEFVLVGALLTVLTLSVIQLGVVLLVRNTVRDAAAEGARFAALAGNTPSDGIRRTRELIDAAIGPHYAQDIAVSRVSIAGVPSERVTVECPLPAVGLISVGGTLEATGDAALELVG